MIRCNNITLEYVVGKPVLRHVNLHLEAGSFTFVSGASGAGKSSLLSMLSLSLQPSSGSLQLFGTDVTNLTREQLPAARRKIGTVFQDFQLLNHLTVAENVALPLKIIGESHEEIHAKVKELIGWIGLEGFADVRPPLLSGGQKQRVAIARAVINKPLLILADEPTGNLDHELSMKLMYLFRSLNKVGTTIVFATHDAALLEAFEYPTIYLRDGQLSRARR
ncbi:MAG: ATP-binding cassette domain-containing protein [Alphaproteobacteria bacterium]|nr:ATP-binding cassette domain-containing protein [Alphaproteobacteria bacterium]